jgi:CHAT domain
MRPLAQGYDELRLRIHPREGCSYLVHASNGSAEASARFDMPVEELELENFILKVNRSRGRRRGIDTSALALARRFGAQLFKALFREEIHGLYRESLVQARSRQRGVRITLCLSASPELIDVPWEYLFDDPTFLAVSQWTPVVRYLDLPRAHRPLMVQAPLRVLAVISLPAELERLDVDRERENLERALSGLSAARAIELHWLDRPTLGALLKALQTHTIHALHYIGHGTYDQERGQGMLLFEDDDGWAQPVSGDKLAMILHDFTSLRLAILNACEGARTARSDPFAGVAGALVQRNIPAVVAMQFGISDEAAIVFAKNFYEPLAAGFPVDASLSQARLAMLAERNDDIEWGTPVLFMRVPDGRIFDLADEHESRQPSAQAINTIDSGSTGPPPVRPSDAPKTHHPVGARFAARRPAATVGSSEGERQRILHPFGAPDGTPEVSDPLRDFVAFEGREFQSGLGMPADDRKVRVLVGRKGAGKTLYLRRLQVTAADDPSLYADAWNIDHPHTTVVLRVFNWASNARDAADLWERIWKCAVLRSVLSHLLYDEPLRDRVDTSVLYQLRSFQDQLCVSMTDKSSAYQQVQDIIYECDQGHGETPTGRRVERYLDNPEWNSLRRRLGEAMESLPPLCFYLDALDEHFERAPVQWLACQKGLCRQVLQLSDVFPRLHVVISVRDLVFAALSDSEHLTRYKRTYKIRTLDWDYSAISYLFEHKLKHLPRDYQLQRSAADPIERWLGICAIPDKRDGNRRGEEPVKDYLLRHTRLIPRDLVQLGNALCGLIDRARDRGDAYVTPDLVCKAVSLAARDAGNEQLIIVANHLTALGITRWTDTGGTDDEASMYQDHMRDRIKQLLADLHVDRIARADLNRFGERAKEVFGEVDLISALWQHGLLGWIQGDRYTGKAVFFDAGHDALSELPMSHKAYALHPILIDAVPGIRAAGRVVHPY